MAEETLKTGEGFRDLEKFVYQVIQQIPTESAYCARFWEIQGELNNTVPHSEQSSSAYNSHFDIVLFYSLGYYNDIQSS